MGWVAMLTVEPDGSVPKALWEAFRGEMDKLEWDRVEPFAGTWCGAYEDDVTEDDAIDMVMEDVAAAADASGLDAFSAVVHFGPSSPAVFSDKDYDEIGDDGGETT